MMQYDGYLDFGWVGLPCLLSVQSRHINSPWDETLTASAGNGLQRPLDTLKDGQLCTIACSMVATLTLPGLNSQAFFLSKAGTSTPLGIKQSPLLRAMAFKGLWIPSKMVVSNPGPSSTDRGCMRSRMVEIWQCATIIIFGEQTKPEACRQGLHVNKHIRVEHM